MPDLNVDTIENCIKNLKLSKSAEVDNIVAEHIVYCFPSIAINLKLLFNIMIRHCYVPDAFGLGILIPIVKDKSGDQGSLDNYRPITLSSVISKLFEMVLLELFSNFMETDQLQFGFKKKSSFSNALFVVRQLFNYYNERRSNIYIASLDASKAFERVNHFTLFSILLKKGFPVYLVDLISNRYLKLSVTVRWNGFNSDFLRIHNGVRQGGVLSPTLFNLYVDCIIKTLSNDGSGCHYMNSYVGCIMYADDLRLISASISNLQCMLNLCGSEGNKLGINFNF